MKRGMEGTKSGGSWKKMQRQRGACEEWMLNAMCLQTRRCCRATAAVAEPPVLLQF